MTLSKHDWGAACRFFPGFRDAPGVIRTAWVLCDLYNEEMQCAWPTRETLSQVLDAPPPSVSRWISVLRESGALTCLRLGILPEETRFKIGRSAKRAQVYVLNFGWAADVLDMRNERAFDREVSANQKVTVSPPFKPEGNGAATPKGNDVATSEGNGTATLIPYTHTLDHTLKEKGALDGSELSVSAREGTENSYARAKGRAA